MSSRSARRPRRRASTTCRRAIRRSSSSKRSTRPGSRRAAEAATTVRINPSHAARWPCFGQGAGTSVELTRPIPAARATGHPHETCRPFCRDRPRPDCLERPRREPRRSVAQDLRNGTELRHDRCVPAVAAWKQHAVRVHLRGTRPLPDQRFRARVHGPPASAGGRPPGIHHRLRQGRLRGRGVPSRGRGLRRAGSDLFHCRGISRLSRRAGDSVLGQRLRRRRR